jgi:hypothetical protein
MCPENLSVLWVSLQKQIIISLCADTCEYEKHCLIKDLLKNTGRTKMDHFEFELKLRTISRKGKRLLLMRWRFSKKNCMK